MVPTLSPQLPDYVMREGRKDRSFRFMAHFFFFLLLLGGNLVYDFRGAANDYILAELERRKTDLKTQLVWFGAQKKPGITSRTWKWVNGKA